MSLVVQPEGKEIKEGRGSKPAQRKGTEDLGNKAVGGKGERRTEYPGFYMIEGQFSKEEFDRKTTRFNTKNKLLFEQASKNLREVLETLTGGKHEE